MTEPEGEAGQPGHVLGDLERMLGLHPKRNPAPGVVPTWRRRRDGESMWGVRLAVVVATALQIAVPNRYEIPPPWLLPTIGVLLAGVFSIAHPRRIDRHTPRRRLVSILLIGAITLANAGSAARLITALLEGRAHEDATTLLLIGGDIWLTNVIVFGMWYWNLDRGGPGARAEDINHHPDLLFPQMTAPDLSPPEWQPEFLDYLYVSFTNAAAFSPTDTMPMARWAKLAMMLQAMVSLGTVVLVIARAVNILKA